MEWQQKLNYMQNKQPGVPGAGSTGNVGYAPGMMSIYGGSQNSKIPSARKLNGMQDLMEQRNWSQRAQAMPTVNGSPSSGTPSAGGSSSAIGPQISNDIAERIMLAIRQDSQRRY